MKDSRALFRVATDAGFLLRPGWSFGPIAVVDRTQDDPFGDPWFAIVHVATGCQVAVGAYTDQVWLARAAARWLASRPVAWERIERSDSVETARRRYGLPMFYAHAAAYALERWDPEAYAC